MDNRRSQKTLIGAIVMTMFAISSYMVIPLFVRPLMIAFGTGAGDITLIFTFAGSGGLITSLLMGKIFKKVLLKPLVVIAGAALTTFFIVLGTSSSLKLIYLAAVIFGFSTVAGGFATAQTAIT